MSETPEPTLDLKTLSERLSLRPAEIYRLIKDDKLKCTPKNGQTWFVEADVIAFSEQRDTAEKEQQQELAEWLARVTPPSPETEEAAPIPETDDGSVLDEKPPETIEQKQTRLLDTLIADASVAGAIDIYLDPLDGAYRLLYRLVGAVKEKGRLSPALAGGLCRELKQRLSAPADIAAPHTGAFGADVPGGKVQLRGTIAPTPFGMHVHLSIQQALPQAVLTETGYTADQAEALLKILDGRPGALISVGPGDPLADRHRLGLAEILAKGDRLVVSLERRSHFRSETLVQLQIGTVEGADFGAVFRAAVNMSPSVLFIDDVPTAAEATAIFEAVSAGMTVIAHMRAADNVNALLKLVDTGVPKAILARDLLGLTAQRVVRRVCPSCRTMRAVTAEEARLLSLPTDAQISVPHCCAECSDGFSARAIFHDLWLNSPDLSAAIRDIAAPGDSLREWGRATEYCLEKALKSAVIAGDVLLEDVAPLFP